MHNFTLTQSLALVFLSLLLVGCQSTLTNRDKGDNIAAISDKNLDAVRGESRFFPLEHGDKEKLVLHLAPETMTHGGDEYALSISKNQTIQIIMPQQVKRAETDTRKLAVGIHPERPDVLQVRLQSLRLTDRGAISLRLTDKLGDVYTLVFVTSDSQGELSETLEIRKRPEATVDAHSLPQPPG